MNTKEFLSSLQKRPAMWWGPSEHPFTSLVAFLSGLNLGHGTSDVTAVDVVPHDFHRFVTEWFGQTYPAGGKGWMSFIRDHTSSEAEAFELLFRLRDEYGRSRGS